MSVRIEDIDFPVCAYPYRVCYGDTDAGGVVYYARYLEMFERARGFYVEEFDLTLVDMLEKNCLFVCRRAELDYLSPARLGDALQIKTWISEKGRSYLTFYYEILCENRRDDENQPLRIASGVTKMACCKENNGRVAPCRIPEWVLERFAAGPKNQK